MPPLSDVRALEDTSRKLERSEQANELPEKKWIEQLVNPGSSLGGARPKANVMDVDGTLYVAKFPSRNDDYNVGLWEHLCHELARKAGITAAKTKVLRAGYKHHTLLSQRFDRKLDQKRRVHFASAMTLLGLEDGDGASTGHGYLDIVDFIIQHCTDVEQNLKELYRRVAFSIAVGNSDDHFRNHGFLLTPRGWTLSLAYDMNPTLKQYQSLLINSNTDESSLDVLLDSHEDYMLREEVANAIIEAVRGAMKGWVARAERLGILNREIAIFVDRWFGE